MKPFAYANASTVEETLQALGEDCRPLAGGTDLLGLMKKGLAAPERLVDVGSIPELEGLARRADGWHIGVLVTLAHLAQLEHQAGQELAVLREAAGESASPQLRHMATIGGNLLQRPRCWYFRNEHVHCWLKGGERCYAAAGRNRYHAILEGGPCYVVHPSDPAVALLALDAEVEIAGLGGRRSVNIADFFALPRQEAWSETILGLDELVVGVRVPLPADGSRGTYVKVAERAVWDFALVSAGVQLVMEGDEVRRARVALGGVAPVPWRARGVEEALVGGPLTAERIERAAGRAAEGARPLAHNAYKIDLARGVVREALTFLV